MNITFKPTIIYKIVRSFISDNNVIANGFVTKQVMKNCVQNLNLELFFFPTEKWAKELPFLHAHVRFHSIGLYNL